MIAVYLKGRLGNQLFQFAFIYAAAKKLKTSFYIDKTYQQFILPEYFSVKRGGLHIFDLLFSIKSYKDVLKYYFKNRFYSSISKLLGLKKIHIYNELPVSQEKQKIVNNALYDGYFQSTLFFSDVEPDIRKLFTIKKKYRQDFASIARVIPANLKTVAIHIRKTDYTGLDFCLPMHYYHDAIKSIHSPGNYYILLSDDPALVKNEFTYLENLYVSHNPEIIDLQFLMSADICILSNSSFSWWGAYFNYNNGKIIAPEYWFGGKSKTEIPCNIIPGNWVKFGYA